MSETIKKPGHLAAFDSAPVMAMALAACLAGRDLPALGQPAWQRFLVARSNLVPRPLRTTIFSRAGAMEAASMRKVEAIDGDAVAAWFASLPPRRTYQTIVFGSSGGAMVHLAALAGAPWLPQTFLVPIARERAGDPDDGPDALRLGRGLGQKVLARNPGLDLHQLHDPNQDRLMTRHMLYFRLKYRALPDAYRRFVMEHLEEGGTILVNDCRKRWPVTRIGEHHVFQHGEIGGATIDEFLHGGPRVAALMRRLKRKRSSWSSPVADDTAADAEWGFIPGPLSELAELAARRRGRLVRIAYDEPEGLSAPVADLYRRRLQAQGHEQPALLAESFVLLDPFRALRHGLVPYWMAFNMEPSRAGLRDYLASRPAVNQVLLTLFAHGVPSVGLPSIDAWQAVRDMGRLPGRWMGVTPSAYPADFAVFARFNAAFAGLPEAQQPAPEPLGGLLAELAAADGVTIEHDDPGAA